MCSGNHQFIGPLHTAKSTAFRIIGKPVHSGFDRITQNQSPPMDYVRQYRRSGCHGCVRPWVATPPSRSVTATALYEFGSLLAPVRPHILMRNSSYCWIIGFAHSLLDHISEPCIMFARLALALDELAHELTYNLRCWPVQSLSCRQKLVP